MKNIAILLSLWAPVSHGLCFEVDNLKGYSARSHAQFKITEDGISYAPTKITIGNNYAQVDDRDCTLLSNNMLTCVMNSKDVGSAVEAWSLYPETKKVVYTSHYSSLTNSGATFFVGTIMGFCK